ncbi:unnamed protein product [Rotaria sordida]|uniref:Uncharacterized protein n=1 Tax=Rotaria sordida TaxID=392033 RepID=A0A814HTR2_9BILA|nr:unnamed protein product [Rotaria sordida]CAF1014026.1 unnamed protein product [Rotaria sordida]CAF1143221.1 unnamed protein product [Rotaria sordida]CAF3743281.1 unnamed protein product [Rotaria sordida]CAF3787382.1 unnamed protein product [Rotaria sordida]
MNHLLENYRNHNEPLKIETTNPYDPSDLIAFKINQVYVDVNKKFKSVLMNEFEKLKELGKADELTELEIIKSDQKQVLQQAEALAKKAEDEAKKAQEKMKKAAKELKAAEEKFIKKKETFKRKYDLE